MMDNKRMGRNLLGILNDLKRDVYTAAKELGIEPDELTSYIEGSRAIPHTLIERASKVWPVNIRDFYVFEDDTDNGILVMRREESEKSSRILQRGGVDYYEYRDTAMSRGSLFRPEWIKELVIVDDNDLSSEKLSWNNGHFLHQFTYFIGPVNFYYKVEGRRFCEELSTGDSMYITPYVPHTFATRKNKEDELGLIIAVTYGGKLAGDAQQELSFLGTELSKKLFLDYSSRNRAFGSTIRTMREQLSMTREVLAKYSSVPVGIIENIETSNSVLSIVPTDNELERLASALKVNKKEFLPIFSSEKPIKVLHHADARSWDYEGYSFVELACTSRMPYSKGFELSFNSIDGYPTLSVISHQYVYNVGKSEVKLCNLSHDKTYTLRPDDSVYIKPKISHSFVPKGDNAKLLVVRIGGRVTGDTMHELSSIGKTGLERLTGELVQWYDDKGKK